MKVNKRILAAVMAAAMVAPMAASCGNDSNGASNDPASTTSTAAETSTDGGEKTKITWAMWIPSAVEEDNGAETRLEEKMPNVDIDFMPFERATWQDQLNARVAGGDIPDIIYRDGQSLVKKYAEQGVLCEVPIEKAKEYAPNIYEASKEFGKDVWMATYADGKNWGLPIMQPRTVNGSSNAWRMDFLEKVGITEIPTTIEEAEQAFLKIIDADVNGSGKNDTYGLTFRGKDLTYGMFYSIVSAFGTLPGVWMLNDDDTVVNGWMKDEAKDALTLLNKWYSLGIIDPEFVTTDAAIYRQKIAGGNVAYLTWCQWYRVQPPQGEYYLDATSGDPNAVLEVAPALKGPNGDYSFVLGNKITSSTTFGSHLANDEEKLNLCLQVVDFVSADTDDAQYIRYGVEGTDYEYNEDGAYVDLYASDANKQAQFGSRMLDSTPGVPALQERNFADSDEHWARYSLDRSYVEGEDYVTWLGFFTDSEKTSISADIDPDFYSGIIDIIVGNRPIDDYDVLRQAWYDAGGQDVTDEYNRAYKEGKEIMDGIIAQIE